MRDRKRTREKRKKEEDSTRTKEIRRQLREKTVVREQERERGGEGSCEVLLIPLNPSSHCSSELKSIIPVKVVSLCLPEAELDGPKKGKKGRGKKGCVCRTQQGRKWSPKKKLDLYPLRAEN